MGRSLNIRLQDGDRERLREIARKVGAIAPSGGPKGQPSISRLLMMIASGELLVDAGRGDQNMALKPELYISRVLDGVWSVDEQGPRFECRLGLYRTERDAIEAKGLMESDPAFLSQKRMQSRVK